MARPLQCVFSGSGKKEISESLSFNANWLVIKLLIGENTMRFTMKKKVLACSIAGGLALFASGAGAQAFPDFAVSEIAVPGANASIVNADKVTGKIVQGIASDKAKAIAKRIKDEGPRGVQAQIQGDQLRVSGKKRDDLQAVQQLLKSKDFEIALQFDNYR